MVVGNGMIAKAFSRYVSDGRLILFASGISNSQATDVREFDREQALLGSVIAEHGSRLLVYISTCSIEDKDVCRSPYVRHKLKMEQMISGSVATYLILRLPQVVGTSNNPHTLVNYLHDRIVRGDRFTIWRNAIRYLIDVEDVARITEHIIDHTAIRNTAVNIASQPYAIPDIVSVLEKIAGKRAQCDIIDKGSKYEIDCAFSSQIAAKLNIRFDESYLETTLKKYYSPSR